MHKGANMANTKVSIKINSVASRVWGIITDIENGTSNISGIERIEILEKPDMGLVGLKWRETRTMFGQTATEVMWITDVIDQKSYRTRAESHGSVYISGFDLQSDNGSTILTMTFEGEPVSLSAKLMNIFTGWMFKKATIKAIRQDLEDIKIAAEKPDP